jgi:hypothetical protein
MSLHVLMGTVLNFGIFRPIFVPASGFPRKLNTTNRLLGSVVMLCSQPETYFASGGKAMPAETIRWYSLVFGLVVTCIWPSWTLAQSLEIITPTETSFEVSEADTRVGLSQDGCAVGHEAACDLVYQRSEYVWTQSHKHGDQVTYSWEMMVPSDFQYNTSGGYLRTARLHYGSGKTLFSFFLDMETGSTFGTKACFGPEEFGRWHAIEVRVAWDSTKKKSLKDSTPGELLVLCDGAEVYSQSGRPNISADEEVWFALGLHGALKLADGDKTEVLFRNVSIEKH